MLVLPLLGCGSEPPAPSDPVVLEAAPPRPPNVLIVLWDTVRADHLSLYGYDRTTTPRLDAFARDAAVYERAISPSMWTVPAHGSLFTGLPASSHGARVGWLWLDDHHVTLAEHLRDQGYATWAWSTNPYLSEQTHLLQGFDTVRYAWRGEDAGPCGEATRAKLLPEDRSNELAPGWTGAEGWPERLVAYKDCAPHAAETFRDWRRSLGPDRPWLAYVNLLEAHHPRVPSAASRAAVAPPDLVGRSLATDASLLRLMSAMEGKSPLDEDERTAVVATYDATLRDLDDATGTLLDTLAEDGDLDRTVVVVLSDHGENLGERGMWDHRWDLHQTLVHVPLVLRYPPSVVPGRHADPVSTGDLFGTVLALTGLPAPIGAGRLPPFGADDRVFTELVTPTPRLPAVVRAWPDLVPRRWDRRYREVVEGRYALLQSDDGYTGLFDLVADPGETTPLVDAERTAAMLAELDRFEERRPKVDIGLRTPEDRPGNPLAGEGDEPLLEALGYAEADP